MATVLLEQKSFTIAHVAQAHTRLESWPIITFSSAYFRFMFFLLHSSSEHKRDASDRMCSTNLSIVFVLLTFIHLYISVTVTLPCCRRIVVYYGRHLLIHRTNTYVPLWFYARLRLRMMQHVSNNVLEMVVAWCHFVRCARDIPKRTATMIPCGWIHCTVRMRYGYFSRNEIPLDGFTYKSKVLSNSECARATANFDEYLAKREKIAEEKK